MRLAELDVIVQQRISIMKRLGAAATLATFNAALIADGLEPVAVGLFYNYRSRAGLSRASLAQSNVVEPEQPRLPIVESIAWKPGYRKSVEILARTAALVDFAGSVEAVRKSLDVLETLS